MIFQTSGHDVQYPGHSHDHRQLHDNREMIHQAVRATKIITLRTSCRGQVRKFRIRRSFLLIPCLDILHVVPVFVEVNGSHQEADDVEGDEHDHDQVVVEELRGLEESFL